MKVAGHGKAGAIKPKGGCSHPGKNKLPCAISSTIGLDVIALRQVPVRQHPPTQLAVGPATSSQHDAALSLEAER